MIVLSVMAFVLPYNLAFLNETTTVKKVMDMVFDISFLVDIILTFFTAIKIPGQDMITSKKKIAKIYLKGWFIFDLLTCVPFEMFE